jgi:hypothetical protein
MDKAAELKTALNSHIIETLKSDGFKDNLKIILLEEIKKTILLKKNEFLEGEIYKGIRAKLKKDILRSVSQASFKELINKLLEENIKTLEKSDKTLGSIIPSAFVNSLKVYIYNHSAEISSTLKELINNENVIKKINTEVINAINGINPMIARFINASVIQAKIISGINDYLSDPKNMMELITMINSALDSFMKKRVSEFASYFPAEGRKALINSISSEIVSNVFSEKFVDMALLKLEELIKKQLQALDEDSEGLNMQISNLVENFINNSYSSLLESDSLKALVEMLSSNLVDNLLKKPLIELFNS